MVGPGHAFFVQVPNKSNARELHPARVIEVAEGLHVVVIKHAKFALEVGQDIVGYFETEKEFMQQSLRVEAVESEDIRLIVGLMPRGTPASAENRKSYRVCTAAMDLCADLGTQCNCAVIDLSDTGFAVISNAEYNKGDVLPASLMYEKEALTQNVCVQSIKVLEPNRTRYGLHAIDTAHPKAVSVLAGIRTKIEREQLKRRAVTS